MFKQAAIGLIKFYQRYISPFLMTSCVYYPSCSEYCKQSVVHYGFVKGVLKGVYRILRCNGFSAGGYDPVLKDENNNTK